MKKYIDETEEWLKMTPVQRLKESGNLWKLYLSLGGSLDAEPDTQSPFYFSEIWDKKSFNRRTSMHHLRCRRI
ncbi:MAG: hypothetical protein HY934_03565 [Candidatus Firestonebacteria bacterium]|nr:hypothetical protein [Candidatus Firestonebacteria bacterium]